MEQKNEYALWIDSLLDSAKENPQQNVIELLTSCGKACGQRKGWIDGMSQMHECAKECKTRKEYVEFMNKAIGPMFEEAEDGIIQHLGNERCNCPMAEKIRHPMLCHCTQGNSKAMWSAFFGKPVDIEIIETVLRGGKECVFKIKV